MLMAIPNLTIDNLLIIFTMIDRQAAGRQTMGCPPVLPAPAAACFCADPSP